MVARGLAGRLPTRLTGARKAGAQLVGWGHAFVPALEYLHVGGLALLCLLVGVEVLGPAGLGLRGETLEWLLYILLGTAFPLLLLALTVAARSARRPVAIGVACLKAALVVACPVLFAWFLRHSDARATSALLIAVPLSLVQVLLMWDTLRAGPGRPWVLFTAVFPLTTLSWFCAFHYLWFARLDDYLLGPNLGIVAAFFAVPLVVINVFPRAAARVHGDGRSGRVAAALGNAGGLLLIALASSRSDALFDLTSFHHWGVFVGPAALVRQGGWLLWDIPSQYGFLGILAIAWIPGLDVWQAMYVVNSACLFLTAALIFAALRSLRPGFVNLCFATLLTIAAVFWLPGNLVELSGPHRYPSLSGFRFIWCHALFAVLAWDLRDGGRRRPRLIVLGCLVWLLGVLWSAESALYCSVIWLPAYCCIGWERAVGGRAGRATATVAGALVAWTLIPALLLAATGAALEAYYRARLGHGPDWRAYYEYTLSFRGGFGALPIDGDGPIWTLLLVFLILATTGAYLLRRGASPAAWRLLLAVTSGCWAIGSYFVGRSHNLNGTSLAPLVCAAVALVLFALARTPDPDLWQGLVRASVVPVLAILLIATVGNLGGLAGYFSSARLGYAPHVERQVPLMDESLRALLAAAQVEPDDPLVVSFYEDGEAFPGNLPRAWFAGGAGGQLVPITRAWLPTQPWTLMTPLSQERRAAYVARYTEQQRLSGWLVEPRDKPYTALPWFAAQLARTHRPTRWFANDEWELIWFEFAPSGAGAPEAGDLPSPH